MATTIQGARGSGHSRHVQLERLLSREGAVLRDRRQSLRDGQTSPTSGVLDFEEHALDGEEQGVGVAVLELTSQTVQGIETALQRLTAGGFGTCFDCRCRISDARLRAVPFAARCVACQERRDMAAGWRERIASAPTGSRGQ